jgi:formylglycine-generating enzyme required for sulfatase activity
MDIREVTNQDYRVCYKAGECKKSGPQYYDFKAPDQPITGISWFDAVDFCRFMGKHLPTEAEWEKAARGPDADLYPWGNQPADCSRAVIRDKQGRSCGNKKRKGTKPKTGRVLPAGSRPAGRYGLVDMMGNAEEWVNDWYTSSYKDCGGDCLGDNTKGPCQGKLKCPGHKYRVVRGGSWYWPAQHATGIHRRPHYPDNRYFHHFGFRCAASVEEAARIRGKQ